jgi:predicted phosphodiesterase
MIMIVSDTHCYYDIVNRQIDYAEDVLGHTITSVIHLGDFGIYTPHLKQYFKKSKKSFRRPLYVIDGNHEDFKHLHKLVRIYKDKFTYLPRATTHTIDGYRFLALGGAAYMDSMITEKGAVITNQQINDCLSFAPDEADIIITHDCPSGIGVPNTPGMGHFGEPGFPRSDELAAHFKPRLWLFGHHHKWYCARDAHTAYYGLAGVWKGFGLLDENYHFTMVSHQVPWDKTPFIEKVLIKLRIIRPESPDYS